MIDKLYTKKGEIEMKKRVLALLLGTSLVLAACGGDDAKETAGGGDAEKLFGQKCSGCHGQKLEGGVGPKLSSIGSELNQADIENIIANGRGAMPKELLKGDDASSVAKWLSEKK
jgi:cytochrome c551